MTGVRAFVASADAALLAARDRLTPGQRWTSSIMATLALAVLVAGTPDRTIVRPSALAPADVGALVARPLPAGGAAGTPARATPEPQALDLLSMPSAGATTPEPPATAPGGAPDQGLTGEGGAATATPIRITALLPAESGAVAGGEAAVAAAFLAGEDIAATAVLADEQACASVGGDRTLVLGPEVVPAELLSCLRASGATLLAFDAEGSRPGVLSTRRSQARSLVVLASWAARTAGVLDGDVGVVAAGGDRAWVDAALPAVRGAGLRVRSTAFVESPGEVAAAVRRFVSEGVEDVVLAAPARLRQQWTAQHGLLDRDVRFVVADAHDGVTGETYPPTFDGALALTTLQPAWHLRAHGESDQQRGCRERWEGSGVARRMAAGDETRWVYAWCQHVAIARHVAQIGGSASESVADVVRSLAVRSPLTSELRAIDDEPWGPQADAVVTWRSSCGCWTERDGFARR